MEWLVTEFTDRSKLLSGAIIFDTNRDFCWQKIFFEQNCFETDNRFQRKIWQLISKEKWWPSKPYPKLSKILEKLLVSDSSIIMGRKLLPGIYSLGKDDVQKERNEPGSATRNPCGQIPHLWGQALFIICRLLIEGCLTPRRGFMLIFWAS